MPESVQKTQKMFSGIMDEISNPGEKREEQERVISDLQLQLEKARREIEELKERLKSDEGKIRNLTEELSKAKRDLSVSKEEIEKYKENQKKVKPVVSNNDAKKRDQKISTSCLPPVSDITPDYIELHVSKLCEELKNYGEQINDKVASDLKSLCEKIVKKSQEIIDSISAKSSDLDSISKKRAESLKSSVKHIGDEGLEQIKSMDNSPEIAKSAISLIEGRKAEYLSELKKMGEMAEEYLEELSSRDLTASYDDSDISNALDNGEDELEQAFDDVVEDLEELSKGVFYGRFNDPFLDVKDYVYDAKHGITGAISDAEIDIKYAIN